MPKEAVVYNTLPGLEEQDLTGYIGFPEYENNDTEAPYMIEINIPNPEDAKKLVEILNHDSYKTMLVNSLRSIKSYWYPALEYGERGGEASFIWIEE